MISKTIDITVTCVLQTTAGKMIFGRFDERSHTVHEKGPATAVASGAERAREPQTSRLGDALT